MDRRELQAKIKQLTEVDSWCDLFQAMQVRSLEEIMKLKPSEFAPSRGEAEKMTAEIERVMMRAEALFIEEFSAIVEAKLDEIK